MTPRKTLGVTLCGLLLAACGSGNDFTTVHGALVHPNGWDMAVEDFERIERAALRIRGVEESSTRLATVEVWITDDDIPCADRGPLSGCTIALFDRTLEHPFQVSLRSSIGCIYSTHYAHELIHVLIGQDTWTTVGRHWESPDFGSADLWRLLTLWRCAE